MNNLNHFFDNVRQYLKHKLKDGKYVINTHEKERKQLYNIMKLTITNGESKSAIIVGPKESGKTTLIQSVLSELDKDLNLQSNTIKIELNGLIHTDDKLALKSCTSQMNLENAVAGKIFSTFADNLSYLLECLRSGERKSFKSLLFIMEEFDLFCFHDNQTLLYNLFDMTHNGEIPICVLGITNREDVIELFEKRVKSRFSHRVINLFPKSDSLDNRLKLIEYLLKIDNCKSTQVCELWNSQISSLINDTGFQNSMQKLYHLTTSDRVLKNMLFQIISRINSNNREIKPDYFEEYVTKLESRLRVQQLKSLSVLEIGLLIAMSQHMEIFDEPFNFVMIFERYNKFSASIRSLHSPKNVVSKAFEHLKSLELITAVSTQKGPEEYAQHKLNLLQSDLKHAISGMQLPTEFTHWFNAINIPS